MTAEAAARALVGTFGGMWHVLGRRAVAAVLVTSSVVGAIGLDGVANAQTDPVSADPGRYIVTLDPQAVSPWLTRMGGDFGEALRVATVKSRVIAGAQGEVLYDYGDRPYVAIETHDPEALAGLDGVVAVQPDVVVRRQLDLSLGNINATTAQLETALSGSRADGSGTTVVVIDDGIQWDHPFFRNTFGTSRVVHEACFNRTDCVANNGIVGRGAAAQYAGNWHGTHVAGIAAGVTTRVETRTLRGVASNVDIVAIKVFDASGTGSLIDLDRALDHVHTLRTGGLTTLSAVNMSLGVESYSTSTCDGFRDATKQRIDQLRNLAVVTVIAAGNASKRAEIGWPACISSALAVGASTSTDTVASFSNVSTYLASTGLVAPGASICSSVPTGVLSSGFGCAGGTSMAAPHVTGALALLKQASVSATAASLISTVRLSRTSINDTRASGSVTGMRRLDVAHAIAFTQPNTGALEGRVVDATGPGAAVAFTETELTLALSSSGLGQAITTTIPTSSDGNFTLTGIPMGSWSVTASAVGYPTTTPQAFTLDTMGNSVAQVNITLSAQTGWLRATVGAGPTLPVNVSATLVPEAGNPWSPVTVTTTTDQDGAFTLSGVRTGTWNLSAVAGSFVSTSITGVVVAPNATTSAVSLTMNPQIGSINGVAQSDLGSQGLANTVLSIEATPVGQPSDRSAFSTTITTTDNGAFVVPVLRIGDWQITVSAANHVAAVKLVSVPEGAISELWILPILRGDVTGSISLVNVQSTSGPGELVPMADAVDGPVLLTFTPIGVNAGLRQAFESSQSLGASNNVFTVYGVVPGDWSVALSAIGFDQVGASPTVSVIAGASTTDLVLSLAAVPYVASLTPTSGLTTATTPVTLTGLHLDGATAVTFGGIPGTSLSTGAGSTLSVVAPTRSTAGAVAVVVTSGRGTASTSFTYTAPPAPSVPPSSGGGAVGGVGGGGGGSGGTRSDPAPATATIAAPSQPGGAVAVDVEVQDGVLGLAFAGVSGAGEVVVQQRSGPPSSGTSGLRLLDRHVDISASGVNFQQVELCVPYAADDPETLGVDPSAMRLLHFVGDLGRRDITTRVDTARRLVCGISDSFSPFAIGSPATERIAGADRYATAVELSTTFFPAGARTVYLASGTGFADALAAGAAAAQAGGPVLLTAPSSLPARVRAELVRLAPTQVVIVGGAAAVSPAVDASVRGALPTAAVVRLQGNDRYATAVEVSKRAFPNGAATVYLATGLGFPDALAGAAAAGRDGAPVLLVPGTRIPAVVGAELARLRPGRVVLLGGTTALSTAVATAVGIAVPAATVTRLQGADRYATAASIAATFTAGSTVFVATGRTFPDALAGAAIAGLQRGPVVVVPDGVLPASLRTALARLRPTRMVVLGGVGALSSAVELQAASYLP